MKVKAMKVMRIIKKEYKKRHKRKNKRLLLC